MRSDMVTYLITSDLLPGGLFRLLALVADSSCSVMGISICQDFAEERVLYIRTSRFPLVVLYHERSGTYSMIISFNLLAQLKLQERLATTSK